MAATAETESYKCQWSRYVARKKLEQDFQLVQKKIMDSQPNGPDLSQGQVDQAIPKISNLASVISNLTGGGLNPPDSENPGKFRVGIVGAGVSGLFTALLFDWLSKEVDGLDVSYDILEAAGEERLGGRLFTWKFSDYEKEKHHYYDVGAMRFPRNHIMKRTFRLFKFLGIDKELIQYHMDDTNNVCPAYFNDIHTVGKVWEKGNTGDIYNLNAGFTPDEKIPEKILNASPGATVEAALTQFLDVARNSLNGLRAAESKPGAAGSDKAEDEFWDVMMRADRMSTRQFLSSTEQLGKHVPPCPGYNFNTVEWLETYTLATGWYNQALTETVLEELDFETPKKGVPGVPERPAHPWACILGGTQQVALKMAEMIKGRVEFQRQVTAIKSNADPRHPEKTIPMTLTIKHNDSKETKLETRDYFTVFNSTTFGALQRMDLSKAGLLWGTKQAIRALGYGSSCKVGMMFKTNWWRDGFGIKDGGVSRTDLPLRVCVYPSYNPKEADSKDKEDKPKPAVLLCSYTWGQDAQRIGTLISQESRDKDGELKRVLFHNLALLHANDKHDYKETLETIESQYIEHHAWDWYKDPNMSGAFAYFGPGQFSNMWPAITKPNSFNQLYLIGEAASAHHAWIVGALESVVRAVYLMFKSLSEAKPDCKIYTDAMKLLKQKPHMTVDADGYADDWLPFYPLPEEMPQDMRPPEARPKEEGKPPTYTTELAALSMIESVLELADVFGLVLEEVAKEAAKEAETGAATA